MNVKTPQLLPTTMPVLGHSRYDFQTYPRHTSSKCSNTRINYHVL